jgi:hypothetical protein
MGGRGYRSGLSFRLGHALAQDPLDLKFQLAFQQIPVFHA